MRRWERAREKSWIPCVRKHIRWAWLGSECCQQCLVFISCLVLTPVWRGVSHLLDQLVRRQRVCCLNVLFSCQQAKQPQTVLEGPRLLVSVSMHHLLYWEMSVTNICLGGCCVFSGISLHSGGVAAGFGLLQCVFLLCLKMGEKRKNGEGTKCSSVPKTPHPVCVVFVVLVLECRDEEWVVNQSYIVMLGGWCLVVCPLVSQGTFGPLYDVVVSSLKKWILEVVAADWWCCQHVFGLLSSDLSEGDKSYMTLQAARLLLLVFASDLTSQTNHTLKYQLHMRPVILCGRK